MLLGMRLPIIRESFVVVVVVVACLLDLHSSHCRLFHLSISIIPTND
jgi:hypothetical protein